MLTFVKSSDGYGYLRYGGVTIGVTNDFIGDGQSQVIRRLLAGERGMPATAETMLSINDDDVFCMRERHCDVVLECSYKDNKAAIDALFEFMIEDSDDDADADMEPGLMNIPINSCAFWRCLWDRIWRVPTSTENP